MHEFTYNLLQQTYQLHFIQSRIHPLKPKVNFSEIIYHRTNTRCVLTFLNFRLFGRCSPVNNMWLIKHTIHNSYSQFTPEFLRAVRRGDVQDLVKWLTQNNMFLLTSVHTCSHNIRLPSVTYIVNNHSHKLWLKNLLDYSCVRKAFWIICTKKSI